LITRKQEIFKKLNEIRDELKQINDEKATSLHAKNDKKNVEKNASMIKNVLINH